VKRNLNLTPKTHFHEYSAKRHQETVWSVETIDAFRPITTVLQIMLRFLPLHAATNVCSTARCRFTIVKRSAKSSCWQASHIDRAASFAKEILFSVEQGCTTCGGLR